MLLHIALIPGDGIGPEVTGQARLVLDRVAAKFGHDIRYSELFAGGVAIDMFGEPLPKETIEGAKNSDAILLGAVGGPKWENIPGIRPEQALLGLRGALGLYANLRPATLFPQLQYACPLKAEIVAQGLDMMIIRELTGGIYFGKSGRSSDNMSAYDTEEYSRSEIERIVKQGAKAAMARGKKLTVVDKANVLESSRLWREVAAQVLAPYTELDVSYMYVDNAAMQLIRNPKQFDVIVTSNIFGDILSDEASMLTGSIGMLPSASLGDSGPGMYEPIHGSAPDIAGKNIANPLATILSVAMMFEYSFGLHEECKTIENAVFRALDMGLRTADIREDASKPAVSTTVMGKAVTDNI